MKTEIVFIAAETIVAIAINIVEEKCDAFKVGFGWMQRCSANAVQCRARCYKHTATAVGSNGIEIGINSRQASRVRQFFILKWVIVRSKKDYLSM